LRTDGGLRGAVFLFFSCVAEYLLLYRLIKTTGIKLSFQISKRYFFSKANPTVVNLITGISLLGYSMGAMALVVLMSALNGFETSIFSAYKKTDPDLLVLPQKGVVVELLQRTAKSGSDKDLIFQLGAVKGVDVVSKVLVGKAVLKYGDQQTVCQVWGVDEAYRKRILLDSLASAGVPKFVDDRAAANPNLISDMAVLSEGLVYKLGVGKIDQPITLMVINKDAGIHDLDAFGMEEFIPSAIVSLPEDQNTQTVMIGLSQAQRIFGASEQAVTQLEIRLDEGVRNDPGEVESVKAEVDAVLKRAGQGEFVVKNQQEQHPLMYRMFNTEKWISFAILSFVLLLISFNLVGALTLLVMDKRRDFVLFRNMGMERYQVSWVVFWEGVWVSVWGTVFGLALGVGLVLLQTHTHIVSTQGTFSIPYPVELRLGDLSLILLLNSFLGILSAVFPAWRAGKMSAEKAMGER
jgi:lipoprotein-releasing system permease protein